jgi:hypothetical protein
VDSRAEELVKKARAAAFRTLARMESDTLKSIGRKTLAGYTRDEMMHDITECQAIEKAFRLLDSF